MFHKNILKILKIDKNFFQWINNKIYKNKVIRKIIIYHFLYNMIVKKRKNYIKIFYFLLTFLIFIYLFIYTFISFYLKLY